MHGFGRVWRGGGGGVKVPQLIGRAGLQQQSQLAKDCNLRAGARKRTACSKLQLEDRCREEDSTTQLLD